MLVHAVELFGLVEQQQQGQELFAAGNQGKKDLVAIQVLGLETAQLAIGLQYRCDHGQARQPPGR